VFEGTTSGRHSEKPDAVRDWIASAYPNAGKIELFARTADADLQAIIDAGRGDVPLTQLRFRCARCGTANTDFVVTAQPGV
jgi:hypothetical protein